MAGTKTSNNMFKELTYDMRKYIFLTSFSSGAMTTESFSDKIELLHLLCFMSFKMQEKDSFKWDSSLKVLEYILDKTIDTSINANGFDNYLVGLSIICDDLMYGCKEIPKPEKYSNGQEVAKKIKSLIDQWCAF